MIYERVSEHYTCWSKNNNNVNKQVREKGGGVQVNIAKMLQKYTM